MLSNSLMTNLSSLVAGHAMAKQQSAMFGSMMRLATGLRINQAADDPSGLPSAESLQASLLAMQQENEAMDRTQRQASSVDATLGIVSDQLQEANQLAIANGGNTLSDEQRSVNQVQINAIVNNIDRIAHYTSFGGQKLLDGSGKLQAGSSEFTIAGIGSDQIGNVTINGESYTLADITSGKALNSKTNAAGAQQAIQAAMQQVNAQREGLGAFSANTVQSQMDANEVAIENMSAAQSTVMDTDYTKEASALIRMQILADTSRTLLGLSMPSQPQLLDLLTPFGRKS